MQESVDFSHGRNDSPQVGLGRKAVTPTHANHQTLEQPPDLGKTRRKHAGQVLRRVALEFIDHAMRCAERIRRTAALTLQQLLPQAAQLAGQLRTRTRLPAVGGRQTGDGAG